MAFEALEIPSRVIEVTTQRAVSAGRLAGSIATETLRDYSGTGAIFTETQVTAYAQAKTMEGTVRYLEERLAGKHNDIISTRPGLTALVKPGAKTRIEQILSGGSQGGLFDVIFDPVEDVEDEQQLFTMRLPEGGYEELPPHRIRFWDIVKPLGGQHVQPTESGSTALHVYTFEIVTIGGNGGEFWQNPELNLNGTRR